MEEINPEDTQNHSLEYQTKIRDQAKQLLSQEKVISLLGKRLKQYNPSEALPITQNSQTQHTTFAQSPIDLLTKHNSIPKQKKDKQQLPKKSQSNSLKKRQNSSNNIYDLYRQLISENERLEKEKEEIKSTLKEEIINNDEQRNQIELLKQTIESSLIQSGLKSKLDLIKQRHYQRTPKEDYSKIIFDITALNNQNDELTSQCNRMKKELKKAELFKEKVEKSVDISIKELDNAKNRICALEKENNILITELSRLSSHNKAIDEELDKAMQEKNSLTKSFEALSIEHNIMKKEYDQIAKEKGDRLKKISQMEAEKEINDVALHEVKVQNEIMLNEKKYTSNQTDQFYSTVKALQEKYDALLNEFFEMKKHNQQLCKDNAFLEGECNGLRGQLYKLNDLSAIENENKRLFSSLNQLENEMSVIKNEKCCIDNYYQTKLSEVSNDRRCSEETVYKQEQEIMHLKQENAELKQNHNENASLINENKQLSDNHRRALNENNFYYNFLNKVVKCLIAHKDLQYKLLNLIDLNIKLMNLSLEKERAPSVVSSSEMDRIYEQILAIEHEVKRYELYSI